ncbi:MAG: hypothetical protein COA52_04200 [Hyphomicrobiales bacterium]|nr:MAG: hypothetical protein COA52_04200 [Hyphomicrobiales bacterium]
MNVINQQYFRPLKPLIGAGILALFAVSLTTGNAVAEDIKWQKYMNSAAVVSAIASAVAMVGSCDKPLEFFETTEGDKLSLSVNCFGSEEQEFTAVIEFIMLYDDVLVPDHFYFAG